MKEATEPWNAEETAIVQHFRELHERLRTGGLDEAQHVEFDVVIARIDAGKIYQRGARPCRYLSEFLDQEGFAERKDKRHRRKERGLLLLDFPELRPFTYSHRELRALCAGEGKRLSPAGRKAVVDRLVAPGFVRERNLSAQIARLVCEVRARETAAQEENTPASDHDGAPPAAEGAGAGDEKAGARPEQHEGDQAGFEGHWPIEETTGLLGDLQENEDTGRGWPTAGLPHPQDESKEPPVVEDLEQEEEQLGGGGSSAGTSEPPPSPPIQYGRLPKQRPIIRTRSVWEMDLSEVASERKGVYAAAVVAWGAMLGAIANLVVRIVADALAILRDHPLLS